MSYTSREIHTRQCCCTVCTKFGRHCHNVPYGRHPGWSYTHQKCTEYSLRIRSGAE